MSNDTNLNLYERAAEMIDCWPGTVIAEVIEADIERGDLEALYEHVCQAEAQAAQEEFADNDIY